MKTDPAQTFQANLLESDHFSADQNHSKLFIGREEEFKRLQGCLNQAAKRSGCFVVLNGEAGIGKSTLIQHFRGFAESENFSSFSVRFRNFPSYDPYQAFLSLVENMNGADSSLVQSYSEDHIDLNGTNNDDIGESLHVLQDKYTFVRQFIVSKINKQAQRNPLLIVLEDLHLASQTTWQFLHYLTERISDQKVMIIASLRQDGNVSHQSTPPYVEILQRMTREALVEKITVDRFDKDHVRKYLSRQYEKSDFSSEFISSLYNACDGIPEKMVKYSHVLQNKKFIFCENDIWYDRGNISKQQLSETLLEKSEYEDLSNRIDKLSIPHDTILKYATLLNVDFDHLLMAKIVNRNKVDVLKDLIYLSNNKFLRNLEDERFQFKHTSTLLAMMKKMNPQQIAKMHQKIAEVLESITHIEPDKKTCLLAHHFKQTTDKKRAFGYLLKAGNLAMQNLAFSEAQEFYQQAIFLADHIPQTKKLIHLYLRCAWNDRMVGLYENSLEFSQKALKLAQKNENYSETNLILLQQAFTYFRLRDWKHAKSCFQACLKNKNELSQFSQASILYGMASIDFELGNYAASGKKFLQALSLAKKINHKPSIAAMSAKILNNLGALESVTGNHMQAILRYSECIPLYESFNDSYGLAQVYNNLGLTYVEEGNWQEANKSFGKSLRFCDLVGNSPLKAIVFLNHAFTFTQLDKVKEAEEYNTKAYRLVKNLNDSLGIAEYHKIQGIIERKEGHWVKAINNFDSALEKFKKLNNTLGYAETTYERGLLAQDMNDEKEFIKWLKLSINNYRELGLSKRILDISKTLSRHSQAYKPKNFKKSEAIVSAK